MDLNECMNRSLAKKAGVNINQAKSLLRSAGKKQEASDALPEKFHEAKLTLLYDALRMILESLALKKGFKVYNHECYTAFLKEVLKEPALGDRFDAFRKIRNAVNYYARELTEDESEKIIRQMKTFIKELNSKCPP